MIFIIMVKVIEKIIDRVIVPKFPIEQYKVYDYNVPLKKLNATHKVIYELSSDVDGKTLRNLFTDTKMIMSMLSMKNIFSDTERQQDKTYLIVYGKS